MEQETIRVLVVDDEFGIREGCRQILAMEHYEVDTAEDGLAGLKLFERNHNYAAALIDLKMPGMGGMELMERIRALDETVTILVITAYATFETAVEATKKGAYGYIPKPFTPDEVLLVLRRALEKRAVDLEAKRLRQERENRLLEVALERSKSSTIIKCMTDSVLVVNADRQVVLLNEAARQVLPGSEGLTLPASLAALSCPDDLIALLEEAVTGGPGSVIMSKEVALGERVFMANVSPLIDTSPQSSGAIAVLRDITALKELETAKSMFISMVAHEVKRPLGVIEGYLNLVLSGMVGEDPAKQKEYLERAMVRAKTLREMVSELMNLTAMETGNFTIKRVPLDAAKVVAEAVEANREKARAKKIELELRLEPEADGKTALADHDAMLIVFSNLVDNAVKYTPDEGAVQVTVATSDNYIKVAVKDNGIGMSPDEQARLFDEFYRVRNRYTAKVPGTGLGLALTHRLVAMHQGKITVESVPDQGSVFTVWLPRPDRKS